MWRTAIVNIVDEVPVLVIDGDPGSGDAYHLTHSLNPAIFRSESKLKVGLKPIVKPVSFLSQDFALQEYHSIYLLNTGRLSESAIKALENYVKNGGGLAFFTGPKTSRSFVNKFLYKEGKGLFPAEVLGQTTLFTDDTNTKDDIIFESKSFLGFIVGFKFMPIRISRYQTLPKGWKPPKDSNTTIAARLRNGAPVILEQSYGNGRVIAVLTTAGRGWNKWSATRNYPLFITVLQGRLAELRHAAAEHFVGSPLRQTVSNKQYQETMTVLTPYPADSPISTFPRKAKILKNKELLFAIGENAKSETDLSGTYQFEYLLNTAGIESKRFAVNIDTGESDIENISVEQLATELKGIEYVYHSYGEMQRREKHLAGVDTSGYLMYLLIAILLGEMALAYSASYHPKRMSAEVAV